MKTNASNTKKYNRSRVLKNAWKILRTNSELTWSTCLKQAWNIEKNGMAVPTIEKIYAKYYQQVFNQILYMIKDRVVAEELTNDVFLKCHKHLETYNVEMAKISTWLHTIAKNTVIDYTRTEGKKKSKSVSTSDFVNSEGDEFFDFVDTTTMNESEREEVMNIITNAIDGLKPNYKALVELIIMQQKKYEEVAIILDMPLNNVRVYLLRAKQQLKAELQEVYQMVFE